MVPQSDIPDFADFAKAPIFGQVADIRAFTLVAEVPPIAVWEDDELSRRVLGRIYEHLQGVVRAAGFYFEDELKSVRESDNIAVNYADDRYDFGVACGGKHIQITREGSRLSSFHDWYVAFMPSAQDVLTNVATILTEELKRQVDILRAMFKFHFIVYDMRRENTGGPVRNSEIMRKLLQGFPDDQGRISSDPAVLDALGRVDVNLTRWIGEPGNRRRLRYNAEAPGNREYSSLWFEFEYVGESYTSPTNGVREAFDPNAFLSEYSQAYVQFLRDSALSGFMEWLLRGYQFKTTPANLP